MSIHTKDQIIEKDGIPAFFVIPYDEFLKLIRDEDTTIPRDVVGFFIKKGMNLVEIWRTYLGLTQKDVAKKVKITQAALSQMEKTDNELRTATLEKLADAM